MFSVAGKDASVPASSRPKEGLGWRVASAIVLAPLAIAAIWSGGWTFAVFVAVAGAVMAWEWTRLVRLGGGRPLGVTLAACVVSATLATAGGAAEVGLAIAALSPLLVVIGSFRPNKGVRLRVASWTAVGGLYLGLPSVALVWLRSDTQTGLMTIAWMIGVVWATDIGAYAFGRLIGGPKLAPRISPSKTWAGLAGGAVSATAIGLATGWMTEGANVVWMGVLSPVLAVTAQVGDLMESAAKRHFGVKDISRLIPGHGGFLDRLDGVLAAGLAVGLASWILGESVLTWQPF